MNLISRYSIYLIPNASVFLKSIIANHIYIILLHESDCDMAKYFTSRLIYFYEPEVSEIKPGSELFCHFTLLSAISGLFYTRYLHCCSLY